MKKKNDSASSAASESPPSKPKKKKEATKSREWERERRERLNNSFNELSKILPTSDNKAVTKKMEILQKATTYIKSLQEENAELLESGGLEKSWSREVKQLQCQVKELTNRNQQLVSLLQEAGGKLPAWVSLPATQPVPPPLGKRQFLYSNKLSQEDAEKTLEKLTEPKPKKPRKTSPQKEKDSNILVKKKKTTPKKQGNVPTTSVDTLNQITPVAQLLNVSSTTNNIINKNKNNDTIPSTSGLVILPSEKNPSIDLAPGILLLKNNSQSHPVPPVNNSLSSGGLLIMRPPTLQSQQSSTLAPGTCILLPPTSSNTMLQTTPLPPQSTNQAPAQTTTILTTPIMATGQSASIVQASQSLTTTNSNNVTPTYVLTNGNLVPVLSTSSSTLTSQTNNNSKHTLAIIPKAINDNKNANKVPIPKLHKRNTKGNKIIIKKKNISSKQSISKISASDLKPLKSIVTSTASTSITILDSPVVSAETETNTLKSVDNLDNNKEIVIESKIEESSTQQKAQEIETTNKNAIPSSTPETTSKTISHKTSYSIDALCKGKNGPTTEVLSDVPVSIPEISQSVTTKPKDTITDQISASNINVSETKQDEKSTKIAEKVDNPKPIEKLLPSTQILKKPEDKAENIVDTSIEKISAKDLDLSKVSKSPENSSGNITDNALPIQSSQASTAMIFTEPLQNTTSRSFYNSFDTCNELRSQEFPPAQISPSGFIGPQPPMATVVSAPLAKDGIDQYTQSPAFRNNNDENCREQENVGISENIVNQQQNDVLSSNIPSSFSSDIFASLNVPSGHPESISPTAAFLLAFPLVSSSTGRNNEMISEQSDIQRSETCNNQSNSLLQLGSIDENQSSVHPIIENDTISTNNNRVVEVNQNNSNILQNNHNLTHHNSQYNKSQSKTINSNISLCSTSTTFSSPAKQSENNHLKQYNSHNALPPMSHAYSINEHLSDYDAEISSIMSNTSQAHDSNQTHNQKVQRNVPSNVNNNNTSCVTKDNEKCRDVIKITDNTASQQYIPAQHVNIHAGNNTNNNNAKQFTPLPIQNNCHQVLPEVQQQVGTHQMQPPIYRPCNSVKNKVQTQHNPYQNISTVQFSSAQQIEGGITSCATVNYNQPAPRTTMANIISHSQHQKLPAPRVTSMRNEHCIQKPPSEQNDTSYYIGKLNTTNSDAKVANSHQKYKVCSSNTTPSQTLSNSKPSIVNNRFDRNLNSSSDNIARHNLIPPTTSQPYSYNIFNNDYQTSSYLPLPNLVSTAATTTSSIISDTSNTTLTSFPKGHNTSNFGILSWSTLSPMSAPNTQQFPNYETNCQKQNTTPYQNTSNTNSYASSNDNQNKIPSYQQPSRAQISYPRPPAPIPPQINKEPVPTPRPPVNWMTTPDIRNENTATHNSFDHTAIPCTSNNNIIHKETNTSCNSFISNSVYTECTDNLGHSWQASKANLQPQNTANPLPTLIGDLALGPTPSSTKYCSSYKTSAINRKQQDKDGNKRNEYNPAGSSGSFLSVSQLVDHNIKETNTTTPRGGSSSRRTTRPTSKAASRRDRNKNQNTQQTLHFNEPPPVVASTTYPTVSNWPAPKSSYKPAPSNYSAEALIGLPVPPQQDFITPTLHTSVDKVNTVDRYSQNYSSRTHFPTDSTNNFFSETIDPTYQQASYTSNCNPSNYQSTSNNYMSNTGQTFHGPDITSSSISGSTSFTTELSSSNFLFPATTSSMGTSRTGFFPSEITTNTTQSKNSNRSNKRRSNNEHSESYQDNSYSNNTSVNQHSHQEYGNSVRSHPTAQQSMVPQASAQSCAPTYHTSRGASVQTTAPPTHSSTSVVVAGGSSLTNFNLSTIFPEMNEKVPVPTLPAFVSSKNLGAGAPPLLGGTSTDYMLHHPNMSFNNLLGPPSHQVGIGINQSFTTPSFSNMMPPSLPFSVHEH